MTFQTINLAGGRVLVKGTDQFGTDGKAVLDGAEWADLKARKEIDSASVQFDTAVKDFFAPLMQAVAAIETEDEQDEAFFVVLNEGVEATAGQAEELVELSTDSVILRLIEEGKTDRLIWITEDQLEILAAPAKTKPAFDVTDVAGVVGELAHS